MSRSLETIKAPEEPPTGFIRTLPRFYADEDSEGGRAHRQALRDLESGAIDHIYIQLAQQPKKEVLHVYICIANQIAVRLNLSHYEKGDSRVCFDGTTRKAKFWAICTGPISRPSAPINRRGRQGHRYTAALW